MNAPGVVEFTDTLKQALLAVGIKPEEISGDRWEVIATVYRDGMGELGGVKIEIIRKDLAPEGINGERETGN